jgi:hypothetical protein
MADDPSTHWHLDKKVPITLILVLAVQLVGGIWFAGRMVERDESQERRLAAIEKSREDENAERQSVIGRIGVLESRVSDVKQAVQDANVKLDRLIERGARP